MFEMSAILRVQTLTDCSVYNNRLQPISDLSPVHTSNNVEATFDFVAKNGNDVELN